MQDTISRNLISNNFKGITVHKESEFTKKHLVYKIDLWKYILKFKCQAGPGESILIGMQNLNTDYLSVCFAAAELSLKIVIIDYTRNDDFKDLTYFDPKTKILSPIDIFLHDFSHKQFKDNPKALAKFTFFSNCSNRTYSICDDIDTSITNKEEFEVAKNIFPRSSDIVMRCTSSGTTGTPKIVEHTHEFIAKVALRNSRKFSGKCLHVRNLNHGSSLAVFLLPTLASEQVTYHIFFDLDETKPLDDFVTTLSEFSQTLENVIFPYPFMIEEFIDASIRKEITWPALNVHTLSYIQEKPKQAISNGLIKSITSIFGSNETSGPIFTAYIDRYCVNQSSNIFDHTDDFYKIKLDKDGLLNVLLPVYNTELITNDIFQQRGAFYVHKGRSDLIKINGEIVDIKIINELNLANPDAYIVSDTVQNCLYLAFWDHYNIELETEYKNFFTNNFNRVQISKISVLNKNKFLTGIKIDNELLREYFRSYV